MTSLRACETVASIAIESQIPKLAVLVLGSKLIVTGVSHCPMHDQKLIMPYDLWARTEDFLTVPHGCSELIHTEIFVVEAEGIGSRDTVTVNDPLSVRC